MDFLLRRYYLDERVTLGELMLRSDRLTISRTLELPWLQNMKDVSCVRDGTYEWNMFKSSKFGYSFRIEGVPDRSGILIHSGNTVDDISGCILVGEHHLFDDEWQVTNSRSSVHFLRMLCLYNQQVSGSIKIETQLDKLPTVRHLDTLLGITN